MSNEGQGKCQPTADDVWDSQPGSRYGLLLEDGDDGTLDAHGHMADPLSREQVKDLHAWLGRWLAKPHKVTLALSEVEDNEEFTFLEVRWEKGSLEVDGYHAASPLGDHWTHRLYKSTFVEVMR